MRRLMLVFAAAVLCLAWLAPPAARAQYYGDPNSLVDYWYRTYLGRPADSGLAYWVDHLRSQPADQVLAGILGSEEYYARAGRTPEGFITQLYVDLLKRRPSPAELDFWVRRLYTEDQTTAADEILRQNPGVWVGADAGVRPGVDVRPGVIVIPRIEYDSHRDWDRDRYGDRHRDVYDYRRPNYPYQRGDEHHRDEHRR